MNVFFEKKSFDIFIKRKKCFKEYPPMFHSHIEIIYAIEGSIAMAVDGKQKTLTKGDAAIVFPYSVHSYEKSEDLECIIIMFEPRGKDVFEKEIFSHKPLTPFFRGSDAVFSVMSRMAEISETGNLIFQKTLSAYITALLGEVLSQLTLISTDDTSLDEVQRVLVFCAENYTSDISLKTVADALYISESYVTKIFSKKLKLPFREFINNLRITKATELLSNSDVKITDIMYKCGFENQSSFNRVFREHCGVSPKEYRKLIKDVR